MSAIEKKARDLYDPNLPYHNFEHAWDAFLTGRKICQRCEEEGIKIDKEVVEKALLFHDAGYHEDAKAKGFFSKEEYAAHLAETTLRELGYAENFIQHVCRAIVSTHRDSDFATNEEKAVRAADLAGLAGDYQDFLQNNMNLRKEAIILSGQDISWEEWKQATEKTIQFYLQQDIHLTQAYTSAGGGSIFHQRASKNLEKFLTEDKTIFVKL